MKSLIVSMAAIASIVVTGASSAIAFADEPDPEPSDQIDISWDGDTTDMSWDGSTYALAEGSFTGITAAVPGDLVQRTATVRNDGPTDATAVVHIVDTSALSTFTDDADLEDFIHLFWNINGHTGDLSWNELRDMESQDTVLTSTSFTVAKGQAFDITVGYYFPSIDKRFCPDLSLALSFDVCVTMQGADDPVGPPDMSAAVSTGGGAVISSKLPVALSVVLFAVGIGGGLVSFSLWIRGKNRRRTAKRG